MENLETNTARTVYARAGDALRCFFFALILPLFSILLPTASYAACGVHNQLCIFHSLGAPVNLQIANTPANQIPTGNNLVIYAIGKGPVTGLPSTVDFDNIPFGKIFADHMLVADYKDHAYRCERHSLRGGAPTTDVGRGEQYGYWCAASLRQSVPSHLQQPHVYGEDYRRPRRR